MNQQSPSGRYEIRTQTRLASMATVAAIVLVIVGFALPLFVSRSLIQDLFVILTMLTLAQLWNLLAGYGGLVSVGQQAFVGIGAYAMFAGVIFLGWDPVAAIALGGVAAILLAVPTAFLAFRLQGAYFAIGTWVIAEVVRLSHSAVARTGRRNRHVPAARSHQRHHLHRDHSGAFRRSRNAASRDILAYWLALVLAVVTIGLIYWLLRNRLGLALSAVRDNQEAAKSVGIDPSRMKWAVFLLACLRNRAGRRAHLCADRPHFARRGLLGHRLDGFCYFHRGHWRHRHPGRTDHRRHRLFRSAVTACRLWQLVPADARRHRHHHHAVCPAGAVGPHIQSHRHCTVPRAPSTDRWLPRQLTIII
jgi:ABC-type branched-subunit amino acid transport system permease subunit